MVFQRFDGYNSFFGLLVAFIKTGAAVANHVFDFCNDTRPANILSYSSDTFLNPLVY